MKPELDKKQLEDVRSLMKDKFPQFVAVTVDSVKNHMRNLQVALGQKDLGAIHAAAHPIGSNSYYLGLTRVMTLARTIEHMADTQKEESKMDIEAIVPYFEDLQAEFEAAMPFLEKEMET